jgi:endonuclease-3 related protein
VGIAVPSFTESMPLIQSSLDEAGAPAPAIADGSAPGSFEAVASVYLAQFGEAKAVARAVDALRDEGWLDPAAIAEADPLAVEDAWRDAGARGLVKLVRPLQRVARWAAGVLDELDVRSTEALRDGLRAIKGIGAATADAILLRGLGRAAYPIDRATYRILVRHGWIDASANYDEARSLVEGALPDDPAGLVRLSDGFERIGRSACRPSVAKCERCPLRPLLPEGGPLVD